MSELPATWAEVRFGEINSFVGSSVDPSKFPDERFELYSVPIFPTRRPEILRGSEIGSTKQAVRPDDVLVCKINPRINRVWQVTPVGIHRQIASSEWIVMRAEELNPAFLRHYFCSPAFREQICEGVTGVGGSLTRAQPKRVAQFPVPIAPLAEQKRIADKLDTLIASVDACRGRLDRIPGLLMRFRQSVLAAATSGELTREWREQRGHGQRRWPFVVLHDVCVSIVDGDHQAPPKANKGIPFITIGAINTGVLKLEDASRFVPEAYFNSLRPERRARFGDVLLSVTGSIGIAALVDTAVPFVFQRHIAVLRPNSERITSEFLRHRLSAEDMKQHGATVATGTAQLTIPLGALRAYKFALPPLAEQQEIVRRVDSLFGIAANMEARCDAATRRVSLLTPSVLAQAFRGKLVPQEPNDEPASKLLARLRTDIAGKGGTPKPSRTRSSSTDAKIGMNMLTRRDVAPAHLTSILKERGALTAEALWTASRLEIDDFYEQLKDEEARGLLRESRVGGPRAPRLLEHAA